MKARNMSGLTLRRPRPPACLAVACRPAITESSHGLGSLELPRCECSPNDWTADLVSTHTVPVVKPIVVVEGVYSFSAALSGFFDFSIWVECPRDIRLARGLARDGEAARSSWEHDWMPGEEQYIERENPRDRVALVCDGSRHDGRSGVVVLQERPGLREPRACGPESEGSNWAEADSQRSKLRACCACAATAAAGWPTRG